MGGVKLNSALASAHNNMHSVQHSMVPDLFCAFHVMHTVWF